MTATKRSLLRNCVTATFVIMVTMNSNWDGVTAFDALDKAANAFVNTYMSNGGNVQKAVDAANKVLERMPGEREQNIGGRVEAKKVN